MSRAFFRQKRRFPGLAFGLIGLIGLLLITTFEGGSRLKCFVRSQVMMGNIPVTITVIAPTRQGNHLYQGMSEAFSRARQIEGEVRKFQAGREGLTVSHAISHLLKNSQGFLELTEGAFDIKHSGAIDFSGIAKGSIVDAMATILKQKGYDNFLINAGGDLWAEGQGQDGPWRIGIQDPSGERGKVIYELSLHNQGMATSGSYERGSHIIDPHTKSPAPNFFSSVSVIAESTETADALATAGFVMGQRAVSFFKKFTEKYSGRTALLIKDGKVWGIEGGIVDEKL